MKNFWNSLTAPWKIVLVVGVLLVGLFILSFVGGWGANVKSWWNDWAYEETMKKDAEYQKTIDELKAKNAELDKKIVATETKYQVLLEADATLAQKAKDESAKLDQALAAQDAVEAQTGETVDAYTRCNRVKQKMIDLGSKTAKEINCEQFK